MGFDHRLIEGTSLRRAEDVGYGVRTLCAVFIAIFLYCGVAGEEWWPFSGWRLFSRMRTDAQESWQVTTVAESGRETPLPFSELPFAYRGFAHLLKEFPRATQAERDSICRTWGEAISERGESVTEVRVYRVSWMLSQRNAKTQRAVRPSERALFHSCPLGDL